MQQSGSGSPIPLHPEQAAARPVGPADRGGERWFGTGDARGESWRPDTFRVIGSAHGPRLLELLRAS